MPCQYVRAWHCLNLMVKKKAQWMAGLFFLELVINICLLNLRYSKQKSIPPSVKDYISYLLHCVCRCQGLDSIHCALWSKNRLQLYKWPNSLFARISSHTHISRIQDIANIPPSKIAHIVWYSQHQIKKGEISRFKEKSAPPISSPSQVPASTSFPAPPSHPPVSDASRHRAS